MVLQEQQINGQSIDGCSSECQNLISSNDIEALYIEEVRLTTDEVFDLEKGLKSECIKVVRLENELKKKEKLHADLAVKFKEVNQKLYLEKNISETCFKLKVSLLRCKMMINRHISILACHPITLSQCC